MILVYGGSFNPPTIAHEAIIHKLYEVFKPENIVIVPTGNHFSWKTDLIDFRHRFKMMHLLTSNLDYVVLSDIENTPDFLGSYHTLNLLGRAYKDLYFVVGADHVNTLDQWKDYKALIKTYKFIILTRHAYVLDVELLEKLNVKYEVLHFDSDISSSKIRKDLSSNLNSLDPKVLDYIVKNNLYKEVNK